MCWKNDGRLCRALADFNKANKLAPNNSFTLMMKGSAKTQLNDEMGALVNLNQTLELEPNNDFALILKRKVFNKMLNNTY